MVGGPHEAAHDVLGVEESTIARGHVDRGDTQGRVHAIHAHSVVLCGDRAGHVRAVGRVVPAPRGGVTIRDAVERAGHGLVVVDLSDQVRHGVIDGLVHDAHRDGRTHDVHALRLEGAQGLEVPSVAGLRVRGEGSVLVTLRRLRSLGAGSGRDRRVRRDSRLVGDRNHGLVTADGRLAGRADRVVADALLHERRAQVGREGGRCRLHEEGAEGRVLGQDESSQERGLGRRALEGGVIRALGQVDRVVGGQLVSAARGGGDTGLGGARRRGSRVSVGRGSRGHGGVRVARDGEDGLAARVIIGLAIEVDAGGADLNAGGHGVRALGQQGAEVHVFDRGTQGRVEVLTRAVAVDGGQAGDVHVQVADRGDGLGVEGDGTGRQSRAVHVLPFTLADPVLQGLDGRLGLVSAHGGQRVDETVAAELLAVLGRLQARVFHGGLLTHEIGDLLALEARVNRLNERGDARDVGRGHRGAAGLGVTRGENRRGHGRVDVLSRRGEVDALAVVGEVGALKVRPLGLGLDVGARGGADLADPLNHGGDLHAILHGAVLDRGVEVGRRPAVGRDVVVVHAIVARRGDNSQPLALRVCDGSGRGLEAGGLLGIARAPVDPRVHGVGVVDDVDAVAGGPHEAAGHVLGVHELLAVGGLDRHEGRCRRDAVDADAVVVGGDNARDVRAVEVVVTPGPVGLGGNAVVPAGDGTGGVDATHEVGVGVVDAGVDDADGDGRVRDRHGRRIGGTHRLGAPVDDLLGFIGLGRALSTQGGRATRL